MNVGSFAGYAPTPLLATYSGTKAFLSAWSLATKYELANKNIVVQYLSNSPIHSPPCHVPPVSCTGILLIADAYLVTTKLAKIRHPSLLIPTETAFVRAALHNIGRQGSPYWSHAYHPRGLPSPINPILSFPP